MSGSLIISLDLELMWGVRDHRSVENYGDAVLGGRKAVVQMLSRFKEANIRATWATVGLLFAKNRSEMLEFAPECKPAYENASLSPYADIENRLIGENEDIDPFHFGASLVNRIADTPGQELATHTYSHYYCMEPGATIKSFKADLTSAKAIAANSGYDLQSMVFPRNQTTNEFIQESTDLNVNVYRGEANGWLYRPRSEQETTKLFRAVRFLDGVVSLGGSQVVHPNRCQLAWNVPASRFLRPWSRKLSIYNTLHIRRIEAEMKLAAQSGGCYHLWWHPHNFGRHLSENLFQLDRLITCFQNCRDEFGMESKNMRDFVIK